MAHAVYAPLEGLRNRQPAVRLPDESRLLSALDSSHPALAAAVAEHRAGRRAASQGLLADHFRFRASPHFFIDPQDVPAAVERARRRYPHWETAILQRAARYGGGEMDVYTRTVRTAAPKLWTRLETGPGRDNLYRVRPHRFGFAPILALAAAYDGSDGAPLEDLIRSWLPFAYGRAGRAYAYSSALVASYRILALTWAMALLPRPAPEMYCTMLRILLADIGFIYRDLGRSFPNNHLLADGFITWYAGFLFPEFRDAHDWRRDGEDLWLRELDRQILADGTSFEHSIHYHEMACDMALAYVLLKRRNGVAVDDGVLQRLERMLRFQLDLGGPEAQVFPLGDTTEDPLFALDAAPGWGTAAFAEAYAALFGSRTWPVADQPARQRSFWLLGGDLPEAPAPAAPRTLASYAQGGYHVFREGGGGTRLLFRTGPHHDAAVSPGHMHADLLTVYLSIDGQRIVDEAGTFSYRSGMDPDWRNHFLGPNAHNGLAIDGVDPIGPVPGSFRGPDVDARITTSAADDRHGIAWVAAANEGRGPYGGHRRGVVHVTGEYWVVYDRLPAPTGRPAHLHLQLAPEATAEQITATAVRVNAAGADLLMACNLPLADIVRGRRDPPRGWVSRRYGQLQEAPSLRWPVADGMPMAATILIPRRMQHDLTIAVHPLGDAGCVIDIAAPGQWSDRLIINEGAGPLAGEDFAFRGALARIRRSASGLPTALDCLGVEDLQDRRTGLAIRSSSPADLSVRGQGRQRSIQGDGAALLNWPG